MKDPAQGNTRGRKCNCESRNMCHCSVDDLENDLVWRIHWLAIVCLAVTTFILALVEFVNSPSIVIRRAIFTLMVVMVLLVFRAVLSKQCKRVHMGYLADGTYKRVLLVIVQGTMWCGITVVVFYASSSIDFTPGMTELDQ